MDKSSSPAGSRINWLSVLTVVSAAILISAEVLGAAFAGGWAVADLTGFDQFHFVISGIEITGTILTQAFFFILGILVMVSFVRNAQQVEPFTTAATDH
jgi:hypothetical protein